MNRERRSAKIDGSRGSCIVLGSESSEGAESWQIRAGAAGFLLLSALAEALALPDRKYSRRVVAAFARIL
jgi:hypothetical protein